MPSATAIKTVLAREILDSRGNPTISTTVTLNDGSVGTAAVPSGASTGTHEAFELRDGTTRFGGKGVLKAVKHTVEDIQKAVKGRDVLDQRGLDQTLITLDGTPNKKRLGANAILSASLASARAGAASTHLSLYRYLRQTGFSSEKSWRMPIPTMNILNGGRHADNNLTVQEFMIVPRQKKFAEAVRLGSQIFHTLAGVLHKKGYRTSVGDEGGFAPDLSNNEDALKLIMQSITAAGFTPGKQVFLALDVAASEFYRSGKYYFDSKNQGWRADKVRRVLKTWIDKYPIISIEDPLAEDDWDEWSEMTKELGRKITIVGDDLFVTNAKRLEQGIAKKAANAILIKVNQIGTLTETIETIRLARKNKYAISISHRSGETADTFIADLAVAANAEFLKAGSLSRSERVEKYNRVMEIESELETRN